MKLKIIHVVMMLAAGAASAVAGEQAYDNKVAAASVEEAVLRDNKAAAAGAEVAGLRDNKAAASVEEAVLRDNKVAVAQGDGMPQAVAAEEGSDEETQAAEVVAKIVAMDRDKARLEAAYKECVAKLDRPAEGVVVPVEQHPDGSVKVDATAEKAQFFEKEGYVWCGDVTVREYAPDGSVKCQFHAEGCLMDRSTKTGWAEGRAEGSYGKTRLEGCGIYFSFSEESVKIYSNVVITSTEIKFEGVKL